MVKTKNSSSNWYVVRAQSNRERTIAERLQKESEVGDLMGILKNVIVPFEKSFTIRNGKKVQKEKILYPSYIFVETDKVGELKHILKGMNGVSGFLTNRAGDIQPLTRSEVERMVGKFEEEKTKEIETTFIVGEDVKILDGAFSSMLGKIESINGDKVKITVSIFGRITILDLSIDHIDKVEK